MLINLTREFISEYTETKISLEHFPLDSDQTKYTGEIWHFICDSMVSTYLDLPGHILETDDGRRGSNLNLADYYRVPSTILHLNRYSNSGAVTADDLRKANGGKDKVNRFLIVHALADQLAPHDVEWRSVYLDFSAVQWIIDSGCKVLISEVYESERIEGVFLQLFKAGVSTVCEPVNLHLLKDCPEPLITIAFQPMPTAQIPITLLAEI